MTRMESKLGNGKTKQSVIDSWQDLLGPGLTEEIIANAHRDIDNGLHKIKDACKCEDIT
jgi:hypothetical protein